MEAFDNPITTIVQSAVKQATGAASVTTTRQRTAAGSAVAGVPGDGGGLTNPDGSQVLVWGVDAWGGGNTWGSNAA